MIEYYKFEIKPWIYPLPNGANAKILEMTVTVDGEQHSSQRMVDEQKPFETEVEYYTRMATGMLHDKLRELEEKA